MNGTNLTSEALALDGPLLSGCASLASLLTTRLYTLQSFAAQAYVTFLSVAGQHVSEGVDALENISKTRERVQPIQPTLGRLYSVLFVQQFVLAIWLDTFHWSPITYRFCY